MQTVVGQSHDGGSLSLISLSLISRHTCLQMSGFVLFVIGPQEGRNKYVLKQGPCSTENLALARLCDVGNSIAFIYCLNNPSKAKPTAVSKD